MYIGVEFCFVFGLRYPHCALGFFNYLSQKNFLVNHFSNCSAWRWRQKSTGTRVRRSALLQDTLYTSCCPRELALSFGMNLLNVGIRLDVCVIYCTNGTMMVSLSMQKFVVRMKPRSHAATRLQSLNVAVNFLKLIDLVTRNVDRLIIGLFCFCQPSRQ
jgi:hypothetical protein